MSVIGMSELRVTFEGYSAPPLPDLSTASLAELLEAEWSGREACRVISGAWLSCQCCGAVKIDGAGHKPGCAMAAALAAKGYEQQPLPPVSD